MKKNKKGWAMTDKELVASLRVFQKTTDKQLKDAMKKKALNDGYFVLQRKGDIVEAITKELKVA